MCSQQSAPSRSTSAGFLVVLVAAATVLARAQVPEPAPPSGIAFDFDNFKPFNDTYGFRQGDRAILLFAELCRKAARPETWFLGHIGGDDFFIGIRGASVEDGVAEVSALIRQFASDIESFYDPEARARGFITAEDREGKTRTFPLLSASAVLCPLPPAPRP